MDQLEMRLWCRPQHKQMPHVRCLCIPPQSQLQPCIAEGAAAHLQACVGGQRLLAQQPLRLAIQLLDELTCSRKGNIQYLAG